jgi:hypothetical protein
MDSVWQAEANKNRLDTLDRNPDRLQVPLLSPVLDIYVVSPSPEIDLRRSCRESRTILSFSNSLSVSSRTEVMAATKTRGQGDSIPFMPNSSAPSSNSLIVSSGTVVVDRRFYFAHVSRPHPSGLRPAAAPTNLRHPWISNTLA